MKEHFERIVKTTRAVALPAICCFLIIACTVAYPVDKCHVAVSTQTDGVDGALALGREVKQFVAVGQKRCAAEHELGGLLRDTALWSRRLFVGRWWDTVRRSMRKAKVSQKSVWSLETLDFFTYPLWQSALTNPAVSVRFEVELCVKRQEAQDEGKNPSRIIACESKLVVGGETTKDEVSTLFSAIGCGTSNLLQHAIFVAALKAYPIIESLEVTYGPLKSRWSEYWPHGFVGRVKLHGLNDTNRSAVLCFKAVMDYDPPMSADGKTAPDMRGVMTGYIKQHGRLECEVVDEK